MMHTKRQISSNTELSENEIKKLRTTLDEEKKSITCIEHLSNELFYEIFDYLDGFKLYEAFSNLNARFQTLLNKSLLRLDTGFSPVMESDLQHRYMNVISSNRRQIVSLSLSSTFNTDFYPTLVAIDSSFNRLESLILFDLRPDNLLPLLLSLISLSRLFSLTIYVDEDIENFSEAYQVISSLPVLKYNKLSVETDETYIPLSITTNYHLSSLQYLIMDHPCTLRELSIMLSCTPQLWHLNCQFLNESNEYIGEEVKMTLSNLTHISIGKCHIPFDTFEIFIKQIASQLQVLRINTYNDTAYLDADRWERLFAEYMPHLRRFEFEHHQFFFGDFELTSHHALIRRFTSPFWTKRQWVIGLSIEVLDWFYAEIIYSIRPYRKTWYELNEPTKSYSNSIQLAQPIELLILDMYFNPWDEVFINEISPIFTVIQITHLMIDYSKIFIGTLILLLRLLPNLDSLKVCSLSLIKPRCLHVEDVENLRLISNNNKITKVNIKNMSELAEVQFLIDLCPRMEYFEVTCSNAVDLKLLIRFILMKTTKCISHLCSLCVCVHKANDTMVNELQKMINFEKLHQDFTITRICNKIYLQLK